jgi:hypothetical protein
MPLFLFSRRAALAAVALAGMAGPPASAPAQEPLPVDQVQPGSRGVARTVLRGTEVEEFDVEILSVIRNMTPKRDMILARALGEEMERLGVAQGMSGSPVYVDGKLLGAIATTWSFAQEPVFGITPAVQMESEADWARDHGGGEASARPRPPGFPDRPASPAEGAAGLRPIGSPLVLSGFDSRVVEAASELFGPWGVTVAEGGSAGRGEGGPIAPGQTLGIRLVGGDVAMTAIGTVTWVDGERVYGWGHPFLQLGDVEMPAVNGYVHAVVPSAAISFKLASGGDVVGTITSDRGSGVAGNLGAAPPVTELDLTVVRHGAPERYRYELARNAAITHTLVGLTAANSILRNGRGFGEETVRFTQNITLGDGRGTTVETLIAGEQTVGQVVGLLSQATKAIATNPFEDVEIVRIDAELRYEPEIRMGVLTELTVDDDTPQPGDVIRGSFTIREYRGGERTHRFAVPLPEDAREGRYLLLVADSRTAEQFEAERDPRSFTPRTLDEYLERIRGLRQTDEIHVHLYRRSDGVLIDGRPLADLPPSALAVMRGAARSGVEEELPAELVHEERIPAGRFLSGAHDVLLEVRKEKP